VIGSPDARVEVVEFMDFGCDQCAGFALETFPAIHEEFVRTGLVRWRIIPFAIGRFRNSAFATEAAECAADQGRFMAMHDSLLARRREWSTLGPATEALARIARDAGLDGEQFDACVRAQRKRDDIRTRKTVAMAMKIYGTPTFILPGDQRLLGAQPVETFRARLRAALAQP
jgi:protein-disulfide isomerase